MLYAKSHKDADARAETAAGLASHTGAVVAAGRAMIASAGRSCLATAGLGEDWFDRLDKVVEAAACIHDLGKANDQFQAMLKNPRLAPPQGVRHEVLSGLLIDGPLREPLEARFGQVLEDALFAATGHHLKFPPSAVPPPGGDLSVRLLLGDEEFARTLRVCRVAAEGLQDLSWGLLPGDAGGVFERVSKLRLRLEQAWTRRDAKERMLVSLAKALTVAADVAGSALLREHLPLDDTVTQSLSRRATNSLLLDVACANRKLSPGALAESLGPLGSDSRAEMQRRVAASRARVTVVEAGCGSGKTLAAYLWAAERSRGGDEKKLFFSYPTTGLTTEGFRSYAIDVPGAELVHSRAEVDRRLLDDEIEEVLDVEGDRDTGEASERVEALRSWGAPIVVCTADTVLGVLQNHRAGLFASPAILSARHVFDEVHSYDETMFGTLLRGLRDLAGLEALLLSASLTEPQRWALRESLGDDVAFLAGPKDFEDVERYRLELRAPRSSALVAGQTDTEEDPINVDDDDNDLPDGKRTSKKKRPTREEKLPSEVADQTRLLADEVKSRVSEGAKVLWVCNTVRRCLEVGDLLVERGVKIEQYHSRFRYLDRVHRHQAVMAGFEDDAGFVAVTTQVAEMSLDIDADLLVTELAPLPAIVQRLGRLNRRAVQGAPTSPRPAFVYSPPTPAPYRFEDLKSCWDALTKLAGRPLSQAALGEALRNRPGSFHPATRSAWLDGGPASEPDLLRDPGYTVPAIRDCDLEEAPDAGPGLRQRLESTLPPEQASLKMEQARAARRRHLVESTLPLPISSSTLTWKRDGYLIVAPTRGRKGQTIVRYDPLRGARLEKSSKDTTNPPEPKATKRASPRPASRKPENAAK